jgi:hypothetical protein
MRLECAPGGRGCQDVQISQPCGRRYIGSGHSRPVACWLGTWALRRVGDHASDLPVFMRDVVGPDFHGWQRAPFDDATRQDYSEAT